MKNGVLYVANGEKYYREALNSAKSAKLHNPDLPLAIHTDVEDPDMSVFALRCGAAPFRYDFGAKIDALLEMPFERTLFIDSDTYICGDLRELFGLLDDFDLLVSREPTREWCGHPESGIPDCFSELNTGVLGFVKSEATSEFLQRWKDAYDDPAAGIYPHDQPTFRKVLYRSRLRFYMLSPEYNARLVYPTMLGGEVKIVHARCDNLNRLAKTLNRARAPRVFTWSIRELFNCVVGFLFLRIGRGKP